MADETRTASQDLGGKSRTDEMLSVEGSTKGEKVDTKRGLLRPELGEILSLCVGQL